MSFNLRQLETFLWLATLGSFRQTAERLHTTQPAISSRIANLEASLGIRLFERQPGSVRLTAKGQELLPYAEKVLRMTTTLREKAGGQANVEGVLRLGVSETVVHSLLPTILSRLHERHRRLDVEITVDATINLRNELVARSLDLAFLMGPISEYSITNIDLASFPIVWAASPDLDMPRGRPLSPSELASFPLITYARNTRPYSELKTMLQETSDMPVRLFPSSSYAAMLRMTTDGFGIGTLPLDLISAELEAGSLQEVPCDLKLADLKFTASYPAEPFNPVAESTAAFARETALGLGFA